jgi:hypothetical protein
VLFINVGSVTAAANPCDNVYGRHEGFDGITVANLLFSRRQLILELSITESLFRLFTLGAWSPAPPASVLWSDPSAPFAAISS